ncbi:MAG: hypothetical protein L3K10_05510, partial [Thermoplasmata archaeon]|nr:hypothetical protein [Thermoplasmata archaeon]
MRAFVTRSWVGWATTLAVVVLVLVLLLPSDAPPARATTARSGAAPLVAFERARSTPSTGAISDWRSLTIPHSPTPRWAAP